MGHRIHRRPSWNYCTYQFISLAFISGSIALYRSYMCLSLVYCLTHVECFHFFDLAAIIAAPKLHTTATVHATTMSSSSSILRKIGRIYRSHTCGRDRFKASLQLAFDLLSTCFRHAFDLLATCFRHAHASRKPSLQQGLQLARIMECGLTIACVHWLSVHFARLAAIHVRQLQSSRAHLVPEWTVW